MPTMCRDEHIYMAEWLERSLFYHETLDSPCSFCQKGDVLVLSVKAIPARLKSA